MSARIRVINDKYVRFDNWPVHINENAHKLWAGKVIDYNENSQHPILLEWLDKKWFNDVMFYDISTLTPGDIVRVNAGSHNKLYPTCFRVMGFYEDTKKKKKIDDTIVMEIFRSDKEKEIRDLRKLIMNELEKINNERSLREVLDIIKKRTRQ